MDEKRPDILILESDNLDEPKLDLDARAERIADVLAAGKPSELFLKMLANMIRPSGKKSCYVLELKHAREGRPKGPDWRIGYEMARLVDDEGINQEAAVSLIQERRGKKGHSRSKCLEAMAKARKDIELARWFDGYIAKENPEND